MAFLPVPVLAALGPLFPLVAPAVTNAVLYSLILGAGFSISLTRKRDLSDDGQSMLMNFNHTNLRGQDIQMLRNNLTVTKLAALDQAMFRTNDFEVNGTLTIDNVSAISWHLINDSTEIMLSTIRTRPSPASNRGNCLSSSPASMRSPKERGLPWIARIQMKRCRLGSTPRSRSLRTIRGIRPRMWLRF